MSTSPYPPSLPNSIQPQLQPHPQPEEEELSYLNLVKEILDTGYEVKEDRTGTGTYELYGKTLRFSLEGGKVPLLTTKKINHKNIILELIMFMKGITNSKYLSDKGVNIWNLNSKDEHGELGPIYGFQWRHYGAQYKDKDFNHSGLGIDQLGNVIDAIRKGDPKDLRRLVISAWNPVDIPDMALPPCHCLFQFIVQGEFLSCILYQRSGDMGLGVPYNFASYSILTHIIARMTGKKAKELIHVIGSAHVYKNHIDGLKEQMKRDGFYFPRVGFKEGKTWNSVDEIEEDDIMIIGYESQPFIKMNMSK